MKILVVDDDPMTARFLQIFLNQEGYEVCTAGTCFEAKRVADREKPKVVITDLSLPDGLGTELVHHLKDRRPIIAISVSGYSASQFEGSVEKSIFDAEFSKPLDATSLLSYLNETKLKELAV